MAVTRGSVKVASLLTHEVAKEFRSGSRSTNLEIGHELVEEEKDVARAYGGGGAQGVSMGGGSCGAAFIA
jgi:hypothetical protein